MREGIVGNDKLDEVPEFSNCGDMLTIVGEKYHPITRFISRQRSSQNAEKSMRIKGRLLDQAMIRFN